MLGVMNRVFPARRYALLGSGGLGYFVILLIRLFFIGVSVWGAYLSVAYAVGHYTSNSFGSIVESSWIAMVILPVVLWLFTVGKDLIVRNRLDSSRPASPSLLLGIWDDSLALGETSDPKSRRRVFVYRTVSVFAVSVLIAVSCNRCFRCRHSISGTRRWIIQFVPTVFDVPDTATRTATRGWSGSHPKFIF